MAAFPRHAATLTSLKRAREELVRLRPLQEDETAGAGVGASDKDLLGIQLSHEKYRGDTNLRTLNTLLRRIDELGFERSEHQLQFHSAFIRSTARVLYRADWGTSRPEIMSKNGWEKVSSEVCISTPRRFGKTFSIAIFVACLAISTKCEVVVFSPARRASRKLLERMIEFVRLLGHSPIEYNQEQARLVNYEGGHSLIRSFPCKQRHTT